MAKKDHKDIASNLVKGFIESSTTPPMQINDGAVVKPVLTKNTHKFTVEFDEDFMQHIRRFAVDKRMKLKPLLEVALQEYMNKHQN